MNIPNAITTLGFIFGIFACYFLTRQDLRMAIVCLFVAGLMDLIDGFFAAKLNQQTDFGKYLDTLVDFFTCCIIPIWMVYDLLNNNPIDNPIVVASLIFYCICGLWRLAYYNIIVAKGNFTGLPVPGAMCLVTMSVWVVSQYGVHIGITAATFFAVGLLMVSGIQLSKYGWWHWLMGLAGVGFLIVVIFTGA